MKLISNFKKLLLSLPSRYDLKWALFPLKVEQRALMLKQNILFNTASGVEKDLYDGKEVVVSLSTFGERIRFAALAIESVMEQTMKANRIVLWLDNSFNGPGKIPNSLKLLQKRGLEIRFTDDLGPHTKLIPSLRAFPDAIIITVDDDCYYDYDMIELLYDTHRQYPDSICGNMVVSITDDDGNGVEFKEWGVGTVDDSPSIRPLAMGAGGVLYPPHSFNEEIFDVARIKELCPKADDIWFKAMALLNGTTVVKTCDIYNTEGKKYLPHPYDDSIKLETYNVGDGGNDLQFKAVMDYYNLWDRLKNNK